MPWYSYADLKDQPLRHCPKCGGDLTVEGGVGIELTSGGPSWAVPSRLTAGGDLVDPTGEVAEGFHSATRCGHCDEILINLDVLEFSEETISETEGQQ